ncbi:MAG TPA: tetratricopeptide repeat protein, partial [bacterium]|nr:tetratricopeptide repeat protein [bacterium]
MKKSFFQAVLTIVLIFAAGCGSSPAKLFEKGNSVKATDKVKARGLYEQACEQNHFEACHNAALLWQNGDDINEENKKARVLFTKACEGQFNESCLILADMWVHGKGGVYKDSMSAFNLYKVLCDRGEGKGCRGMGEMYSKGAASLDRDVKKAIELFEMACEKGDMKTCVDLGQTWSKKFEDPEGYEKVELFWGKACMSGMIDICEKFADMIVFRKEKEERLPLSRKYYEK